MKLDSKTIILIAWGTVALGASMCALMKPLGLGVSDSATVERFSVYKGLGDLGQLQSGKVDHITQVELKNSLLYICGYLTTDGRPARLRILIRDENSQLVHDIYKEYPPGVFCEELTDDLLMQKGNYEIMVFKARDKIAETTLEVID